MLHNTQYTETYRQDVGDLRGKKFGGASPSGRGVETKIRIERPGASVVVLETMVRSVREAEVKRVEGPRFITGTGRFLADFRVDGAVWVVPVRSVVPHGVVGVIDTDAALGVPGVVRVYLAGDLDMAPMPLGAPGLAEVTRRPTIALERVRFAGDIVAVVVAESEQTVRDAADLVWADTGSAAM